MKEERKCVSVLVYDVCRVHTYIERNQKRNRQKKTCVNRESSKSEKEITKTFFFFSVLRQFRTCNTYCRPCACVVVCTGNFKKCFFVYHKTIFFAYFIKKNYFVDCIKQISFATFHCGYFPVVHEPLDGNLHDCHIFV